MKRLLIAIAAAATTMFASAAVIESEDFEGSSLWTGVTAAEYGGETPVALQYPFTATNAKYGVLDDDASSPAAEGATCFDMYVQFKPLTEEPAELADGAKLAVYADADGFIHVLTTTGNYKTEGTVDYDGADKWVRLTIVAEAEAESKGYKVYVNGGDPILGAVEGSDDSVSVFPATTGATTVEFTGSGKLDNFVARTTNPFYSGEYAASTGDGNEKYATYSDALADVLSSGATDAITIAGETPTKTVDGTAANPYEITNLADLKALQAAVAAGKGADKCYVQTADIALTEAWPGIGVQNGKDICTTAEFDNGAFTGTYDGGNYTISNFQMVDGLDYCGFFNSVKGATIKNLKISYKDGSFAKDMVAAKEVCGATFVGVAKASTLQNLTSLAGTVSCTKGFGGIVGYLMAGSTVDSCTNNVNLTSTASNKAGGIAMITQNGSGTATIRNCQNNGTTAGNANQKGGIVGYVGVATAIDGCSDTAGSTPSILHNQGQTVTISGVITAPTNVVAYTTSDNNPIDGLDFATVDANGIATFVKAADLAAGNTYKVMGPKAKATYAFTDTGSISFDTSLATPTYAVTVANPNLFDLTDATEGTVKTYTAAGGTAVASITKGETTTQFNTVAKALAAAKSGDTVVLLDNNADAITIPAGVTVDCGEFANTGAIDGAGAIKLNAAPATALAFAENWTGTVELDFDVSGNNVDFNVYGKTGSTVELLQDFTGYPSQNAVIDPALKLSANMTINDGWQNETNATFTAISGTGTLTASHTYNYVKFYRIKKLDGFTGTLASGQPRVYFVIDDIVAAETPAYGTAVVKGSSLKVYDLASTTLGGVAADLCVDTLDNQNGIYLVAAQVVADDQSTTGYASVENALAAADAAYASTVNVLDSGAEEVAAAGWSYENGVYTSTREVATLNDTSYPSLAKALVAAQDGDTVTLVAASSEAVTIPAGVTVAVTDGVAFNGTVAGAGAVKYTAAQTGTIKFGEWTGTVTLDWAGIVNANDIAPVVSKYGKEGSTVEIGPNGTITGDSYFNSDPVVTLKVSGFVSINNGSTNNERTLPTVTGDGVLVFGSSGGRVNYRITNLVEWDGVVTNSSAAVGIANVTSGSGKIVFASTPDIAPAIGEGFTGEVYLNFNYSNYNIALYGGVNATRYLGTMSGHLHDGAGETGQTGEIPGKTVVAGTVALNNGWPIGSANWTAAKVVKFDSLKVDGSLTLDSTTTGFGTARCYCYVRSLDAAGAGAITVGDGFGLRIDAVDFAEAPSGSDVLVGLTLAKADLLTTDGQLFGTDGTLNGSIAVTVNGESTEQTLVYDADKGGLVLYVEPVVTYAATDSLGNNYTDVYGALSYVYTMGTAGDYVTVLDETYEDKGLYADYFTWDATARTYTLRTMVAMCDDVKYATLAAAVGGAAEGKTIILLADIALTETQTISKSLTLNLSGHNVTATDCRAFHVTAGTVAFTGTGTISTVVTQGTKLASSSSVIRVGSDTAETNFTLGEYVTVTSDYCYGITYFGTKKQTVVINGTVTVTGVQAAISGNGTKTMAAVTLTVGGTVSATQDYAIYNPQTGTTAITGTVTGGIEVKAGTVTVAGTATVTARNVTPSHSSNQNGTSTQGYAIAAVGNSSYKQPAKVSVAAGATVTGSVIILKENNSETYGEITSAVNTLTIPEGYVWNGPADGVYTLAVYVAPAVIDPTAGTPIVAADETAAQAAAQALDVGGMPEVSGLDQTTWNGYFTRYAEETDGGWVAKAALNPEAVFDATPTAEATDEQAILTAVLDSKATGATLQTAKPGLYYSLEGATTLGFVEPVEGKRTLATSSEVPVTKPAISGNAVFFRVKVSATDKAE